MPCRSSEQRLPYAQKVRNENTVFHLDCDGEYAGNLPMHVEVLQGGVNLLLPIENRKTTQIVAETQEQPNQ